MDRSRSGVRGSGPLVSEPGAAADAAVGVPGGEAWGGWEEESRDSENWEGAGPGGTTEDGLEASEVLSSANQLLRASGIAAEPLTSVVELQDSASSMLVAVFERVLGVTVEGVRRHPESHDDYTWNAALVLGALQDMLPSDHAWPRQVTAEAVAKGELGTVAYLVSLLADIRTVLASSGAADTEALRSALAGGDWGRGVMIGGGGFVGGRRKKKKGKGKTVGDGVEETRPSSRRRKRSSDVPLFIGPPLSDDEEEEEKSRFKTTRRKKSRPLWEEGRTRPGTAPHGQARPVSRRRTKKPSEASKRRAELARQAYGVGGSSTSSSSNNARRRPASRRRPHTARMSRTHHKSVEDEWVAAKERARTLQEHGAAFGWTVQESMENEEKQKESDEKINTEPSQKEEEEEEEDEEIVLGVADGGGRGGKGGYREIPAGPSDLMGQRAVEARRAAIRRVLHARQSELERLRNAHDSALRRRLAMRRVAEQEFVRAARHRARAAEHARRTAAVRAQQFVAEMHRRAVARTVYRESAADAVAVALARATADQVRAEAVELARARAARAADAAHRALTEQRAAEDESRVRQDVLAQEAAREASERTRLALALQREAQQDVREMRMADKRAMRQAQLLAQQADQQWKAATLDPVDVRPDSNRLPNPALDTQRAWQALQNDRKAPMPWEITKF